MSEVVRLERGLKTVICQRVRQAKHASIENENVQWTTVTQIQVTQHNEITQ